ncbi:phosphatase PAP2 family protein [Yinghuangia seranimata]|uniref:phosphatase PAP2 family protein n=1 Tax=Yinghuangia seranimata TaxID=408067 RepID=UPI00248AF8B2|nr:phosphatase PAP2 family protein [Yinghuangia seranimata]MDI2131969.1 phosphatase PAP2 family protein [Yinghuangia seranimata]
MTDLTPRRIGAVQVGGPATAAFAAVAAAAAVLLSPPGRAALDAAPLVLAAVLLGTAALALPDRPRRVPETVRGAAVGVAAVFDPVALALVPLLWLTGRRRGTVAAGAVAAVLLGPTLAAGGLPSSSWRPLLTDSYIPGDDPDASLRGMLLRVAGPYAHGIMGADTPAMSVGAALLGLAVLVLALPRAARWYADGQPVLAVAVAACAGAVVLPVSWTYELLWLPLALAGRLGRRPEERWVWPALVVVAAAVPRDAIDPRIDTLLSTAAGNVPTLVLLAAACALPFRNRTDPHWDVHRAPPPALPQGRRALLPAAARPLTRPNLLLELLLIRAGYWVYQNIRGDLRESIPHQREQATDNARTIVRIEEFLHIDVEAAVNRLALRSHGLFRLMQDYYREMHYTVPVLVLAWLYMRHPTRYRTARTVLALTTGLALVGFWLFPLCPPRLYPGSGLISSLPGSPPNYIFATNLINKYAAMPSLHIGWALWCAVTVACVVRQRWVKAAVFAYPTATLFVVVGTANHWVLDGVGAAVALGVAVLGQRALTGRRLRDHVPAFLARLGTAPANGQGRPQTLPARPVIPWATF